MYFPANVSLWCLSVLSLSEIDPILAILRSVLQCGTIRPSEIGILTPYDAQKARIRFALNDSFVSREVSDISTSSITDICQRQQQRQLLPLRLVACLSGWGPPVACVWGLLFLSHA